MTYLLVTLSPSVWLRLLRVSSFLALFTNELLRQEQAKLNEARKISVVNVNPTNIRPHSDTPEIRKYKKRFNSEILCAALWGNPLNNACKYRNDICVSKTPITYKKCWFLFCATFIARLWQDIKRP